MSDLSKVCDRLGDQAAGIVTRASVDDLNGYWLELHCCGGTTILPVRLIVKRQGGRHRLGDVLDRMKCQLCRGGPVRAYLNETPNRTPNHGAPPGWSVQLIPCPAPASMAEAAE